MKEIRKKGDNTVLLILVIIILAVALFVGISYGHEKGVILCNKYYSAHINNQCVCYAPVNLYKTERFIPISIINLSTS